MLARSAPPCLVRVPCLPPSLSLGTGPPTPLTHAPKLNSLERPIVGVNFLPLRPLFPLQSLHCPHPFFSGGFRSTETVARRCSFMLRPWCVANHYEITVHVGHGGKVQPIVKPWIRWKWVFSLTLWLSYFHSRSGRDDDNNSLPCQKSKHRSSR
jgi:hypothetical protein